MIQSSVMDIDDPRYKRIILTKLIPRIGTTCLLCMNFTTQVIMHFFKQQHATRLKLLKLRRMSLHHHYRTNDAMVIKTVEVYLLAMDDDVS